jgi:hypothetical protein
MQTSRQRLRGGAVCVCGGRVRAFSRLLALGTAAVWALWSATVELPPSNRTGSLRAIANQGSGAPVECRQAAASNANDLVARQ